MIKMSKEKPDDNGNVKIVEHIKIIDTDTNETLLNMRDKTIINNLKQAIK